MKLQLAICKDYSQFDHTIILVNNATKLSSLGIDKAEAEAVHVFFEQKINSVWQKTAVGKTTSIVKIDTNKDEYKWLEAARNAGNSANKFLNSLKIKEASVYNATPKARLAAAFAEGAALGNYEFLKYKTRDVKTKTLATLHIDARSIDKKTLEEISKIADANFFTRTLINEPLSF